MAILSNGRGVVYGIIRQDYAHRGRTMDQNRVYLNNDWFFGENGSKEREVVRLPHSTVITPYHYFDEEIYQKETTYERTLFAKEAWMGQHVL